MNNMSKYADPVAFAAMPVSEVLEDMVEMGADKLQVMIDDANGDALGGVVLIRGENSERYRRALERVEQEIEQEQEQSHD